MKFYQLNWSILNTTMQLRAMIQLAFRLYGIWKEIFFMPLDMEFYGVAKAMALQHNQMTTAVCSLKNYQIVSTFLDRWTRNFSLCQKCKLRNSQNKFCTTQTDLHFEESHRKLSIDEARRLGILSFSSGSFWCLYQSGVCGMKVLEKWKSLVSFDFSS